MSLQPGLSDPLHGGEKRSSESPYLGIYTKSSPRVDFKGNFFHEKSGRIDSETGEVLELEGFDSVGHRLERFALQSAARSILWGSRTANCLRLAIPKKDIQVWKSKEHQTGSFSGLAVCASVWACPVCASKISQRRRNELETAIQRFRADSGDVLLLTLTNPHHAGNNLLELLQGQQKAMSRFNSTKQALRFWDFLGCVGTVRAWEVTHGVNGWHPHFHILAFVRLGVDLIEARQQLYDLWANSCRLASLPIPSAEHGVDLRDGTEAAAYASKWGLEDEMTKGHIKKSRASKGRSPFDLLRSFLYDGDRMAGGLFRVFAMAFKGKRQLVWSKGLKALFQIAESSDEELSAHLEDSALLLGNIALDDWRLILRFDVRGEVLELARHGWEPIQRMIEDLRNQVARSPDFSCMYSSPGCTK